MRLDLDEIDGALKATGENFVRSLVTQKDKDQAAVWTFQAGKVLLRAKTLPPGPDRAAAVKELQDFEDAFSMKFGTMELRGAEAARQALFDAGKRLLPILLKAAVALLL